MLLEFIIKKVLIKSMDFRGDGAPALEYTRPTAFGVNGKPISFKSGSNTLNGGCYFTKPPYKGVVIFFHGLGTGHRAYSREIAILAKAGFLVYAYDKTGCMTSTGHSLVSLAQNRLDMPEFFKFLDKEEIAKGLPRYAMGHSWGGFNALTLLAHPEYGVSKIISMSGFTSIPKVCIDKSPLAKKCQRPLKKALKSLYGDEGVFDASDYIATTPIKVFYLQGSKDEIVPLWCGHDDLEKALQNHPNPNVTLYLKKDFGHSPYLTKKAEEAFWELFHGLDPMSVDRDLTKEIDYDTICEDDMDIFKILIDFLEQ